MNRREFLKSILTFSALFPISRLLVGSAGTPGAASAGKDGIPKVYLLQKSLRNP